MATIESGFVDEYAGQSVANVLGLLAGRYVHVQTVAGYETRKSSSRGFAPEGLVIHWTAVSDTGDACFDLIRDTALCQLYLDNSHLTRSDGIPTLWIMSINRTGHIGQGNSDVLDKVRREQRQTFARHRNKGDVYPYASYIGIEVEGSGSKPYEQAKWDAMWAVMAALAVASGWGPERIINHAISTSRKVDIPEDWGPTLNPLPWDKAGQLMQGQWLATATKWIDTIRSQANNLTLGDRVLKLTDPNMRGADVGQAQALLRDAGFNPGQIDDIYGPATALAVEQFQRANGLTVDGIIGPQTATMLLDGVPGEPLPPPAPPQTLYPRPANAWMTGPDVDLARSKWKLGPGPYSEWFVEQAVKPYQISVGLVPDGIIGPQTWYKLLAI